MSKFIIKSCHCLVDCVYADGRETQNECANSLTDEKCAEVKECPFKQVAEHLLKVVEDPTCRRCDGCGYENGCADESCGTYAAYKCLTLLGAEFVEEKNNLENNRKI